MNAITRHVNEQAKNAFKIFVDNLTAVAPYLKREFLVTDKYDGEMMNFAIDGYAFTLAWSEGIRKAIGRELVVPEYQLSIWHTVGGTLVTTQSIHECITCALETVAKDEIRQCLEGAGYELMAKEEAQLEPM